MPTIPSNQKTAAVWESGGTSYDEISRSIADAIEHCVVRLDPKRGESILDVATGTGWTARRLAERGALVVGVDFGAALIKAAREITGRHGLNVEYRVEDAESLPFEDRRFDAVVSTFGVMFASRPEVVAAELSRVCRPGGRLALAAWTPESSVVSMFTIVRGFMPAPPSPTPSPFAWGLPKRVQELLGDTFALRFEQGVSFYREPSAESAWDTFVAGYGPIKSLAASLDEEQRSELRAQFVSLHQEFATELGITMPREYLLAVGTRRE